MKSKLLDPWLLLVAVVMGIGVAIRVFCAWTTQYMPNSDHGLVALMARHMAEARDFPVFFYGQPYMGSLEPAVSAALIRLFGSTAFMVCLGTALTGALMLPIVYVYGRDADSRWAGLFAMVYTIVGSQVVLYFSVAPRGGYMTMMVCGFPTVWLACRIATRLHAGHKVSPWTYAVLGLLAGLGWWSNQLVIVFLVTACVILLMAFRMAMIVTGLVPALAGFAIGGLPWWLWNITHGWGSFDFTGTFGKVTFRQGLWSFWEQFLSLTGLLPLASWWQKGRVVLLLLALSAFVGIVIRDHLKKRDAGRFYYRVALPILTLVMLALYARSHYSKFDTASRYLMPLVPAVAVMLGVVCSRLLVWRRIPVGVLLLAAVMPPYTLQFHRTWQTMHRERETFEQAQRLADYLAPRSDGTALGDWVLFHWMNFASDERLRIAFLPTERYAPYAIQAELAETPVVIGDFKRFRTFLATTGGSSTQDNLNGLDIDLDIRPPSDDWNYVATGQIESVTDGAGTLAAGALNDLCLDTGWGGQVNRRTNAVLTFTFREPVPVCGVRFLSATERYPPAVSIHAQNAEDPAWVPLAPRQRATCFFWSGRSAKVDGLQYFQELRFPAPTGGVRRLAITFDPADRDIPRTFDLAEVRLLATAPSAGELPTVDACVAAIRQQGIKRLYAPRWLASRVWVAMRDTIDVTIPGNLRRSINDLTVRDRTAPEPVVVGNNTGFVCDRRDADSSRRVLNERGVSWHETPLGRYVLLTVSAPGEELQAARLPTLYWTDLGCFGADMSRFAKDKAEQLFQTARRFDAAGRAADAERLLRQALQAYPRHQPASETLTALLKTAGRLAEADAESLRLSSMIVPAVQTPVRFAGGIELLGVSLSTNRAPRGGFVDVAYFWKAPPSVFKKRRPGVFVHWTCENTLFQDDHCLLEDLRPDAAAYQPYPETFVTTRRVAIPASMPPGAYRLVCGLHDRTNGKRYRPQTSLKQERNAVELPVAINVGP